LREGPYRTLGKKKNGNWGEIRRKKRGRKTKVFPTTKKTGGPKSMVLRVAHLPWFLFGRPAVEKKKIKKTTRFFKERGERKRVFPLMGSPFQNGKKRGLTITTSPPPEKGGGKNFPGSQPAPLPEK